jgi:membrane protein YdbS with pleckstrin-like domain
MSDEPAMGNSGLGEHTGAAGEVSEQPAEQPAGAEHGIGGDGDQIDPAAETEIWAGRTHWKHYAGRLALWLAGNVVVAVLVGLAAGRADWLGAGGAFWFITGLVVVSGAIVVGGVAAKILGTRYRLTTQRLFIERGIVSQTVDQTELIRVDDVRMKKGLIDRMFGLGSVESLSTDVTDRVTVIAGIAEPEKVAEAIRTQMRTMRKKSLFVEHL